jgi:hypothetical protein
MILSLIHDFSRGDTASDRKSVSTHEFIRGATDPNRKSPVIHEFIRGNKTRR